ncbi:hypothetical protein RND71_029780 [Anisodus tanguticus]|uniref:Sm domain-containing protein n=1 Tax=Anisodus tanguticus TaxID=243964 RepID=A0AAE1V0H8_9SOLA|nr:hypothetical protein RND71_029780 [Anisodus tanguticus]
MDKGRILQITLFENLDLQIRERKYECFFSLSRDSVLESCLEGYAANPTEDFLDFFSELMPAQCRKVKEVGDLMTGEPATEAPVYRRMSGRKESVLDLTKFVNKAVQVKLTGGRQVVGTLKGYDQLLNVVLDEAIEHLRDSNDPLKSTGQTRLIGLIVCKGSAVMLVAPEDGTDD